jgi:hypothetical protein
VSAVPFTDAEEHLLSRLEVQIERGLEEVVEQEWAERQVELYVAGAQMLLVIEELLAAADAEGRGSEAREWVRVELGPAIDKYEAAIAWIKSQEES